MNKGLVLFVLFVHFFLLSSVSAGNFMKRKIGDTKCNFVSNVISADTKGDTYDLLMSFSTYGSFDNCNYICEVNKDNDVVIGEMMDSYEFKGEYYTFLRFPNLQNYNNYSFTCTSGQNNETGSFQFPKGSIEVARIITFGDWSKTDRGIQTYNTLKKHIPNADAIVFLGDIAYDLYKKNGAVGNDFMDFSKEITRALPFQMTTGNHETHDSFSDFTKRFVMPNRAQTNNLYYSYDIKNAHFISVNSEAKDNYFNPEYIVQLTTWLENDLRNSKKRWNFIYLHRPLYCSWSDDYHCGSGAKSMRDIYEKISLKYKVDMIIAGHTHAYERMFPIYEGKVDTNSLSEDKNTYTNPIYPAHVICGSGGNIEDFAKYDPKDFSKIVLPTNGICEMDIKDNEINFRFYDGGSNEVKDTFKLIKTTK